MGTPAQERALRDGATPLALRVHAATRALIRGLLYPYFGLAVRGRHKLDVPGAVILAPVHRSNLDSLLAATIGDRRTRVVAKHTLFRSRPFAWYIACLGAFPVTRGAADREAMRAARELLDSGEQLLVFPEGTRQSGAEVGELFGGTAFLAARTGATVLPIGIAGTEDALPPGTRFPRRQRVSVVVGDPLPPLVGAAGARPRRSDLDLFTGQLRDRMQAAFDQARRDLAQPR